MAAWVGGCKNWYTSQQATPALNQYNLAEDAETRARFAKRMAKYRAAAPPADEVTQGQITRLRMEVNAL
jgi:hypothetical protein